MRRQKKPNIYIRGHTMIYFGFILAISILAGMIYMALDKKTNSAARLATLVALGVMVLTVIICLFFALTSNTVPFDESTFIVGAPVETKKDNGNSTVTLVFSVAMIIALFAVIVFLAFKEMKKNTPKKKVKKETADNFEFLPGD
jgi:magnesium-transporting ATPase (P-type)